MELACIIVDLLTLEVHYGCCIIKYILGDLTKLNSEIEGVAVISSDGLTLVARLPEYINESNLGTVVAAFLSLGIRTDKEVKKKGFQQAIK